MLQLSALRENTERIIERLSIKNFDGKEIIPGIIFLDDKRKETQKKLDDNFAQGNINAKEIGNLFKSGKAEEVVIPKEELVSPVTK